MEEGGMVPCDDFWLSAPTDLSESVLPTYSPGPSSRTQGTIMEECLSPTVLHMPGGLPVGGKGRGDSTDCRFQRRGEGAVAHCISACGLYPLQGEDSFLLLPQRYPSLGLRHEYCRVFVKRREKRFSFRYASAAEVGLFSPYTKGYA